MASAGDSKDPTDINGVLENLGSLIGELDACVTETGGKAVTSEVEDNQNFDVHLESLLADTDEFDDDDEYQCLIPHQRSSSDRTTTSIINQTHNKSSMERAVSSTRTFPQQSLNSNSGSINRTQENQYSTPPNRSGHKGASKEVALSVELHGSFKRVDESSVTASAQKNATPNHNAAPHVKAQPNHYVGPSELGFKRHNPAKSGATTNGIMPCSQQHTTQEKHKMQHVTVVVFDEDGNPVGLEVSSSMKAREACYRLTMLNKVEDDPQWVLTEYLTDLGIERTLEDHENLMSILKTWAPSSNNKLMFRKDPRKYHFFAHTTNYFPSHLLDSESSDKAVTEKAQKAKTILQQKLFSTCTRVPEIEGILHCKDFGKKSWSKKFFFLRGSGLYSSSKGKSKASKDLECYVQFDGANLYNIINPKKSHKAPAEFCFCIVPHRARELKELKCLSTDDEKTMMSWMMAVRIAKFGPQLRQNYDDMIRKFAKLTKYREQSSESQDVSSEKEDEGMKETTREGRVPMDFSGERGKVITDLNEIQQLANIRNNAKLSKRMSSEHFIPNHTVTSGHHFVNEPWFHGRITREHSLHLLVAAGIDDGLFLVRESSSVPGVFVLTFCMNRKVYHCQLVEDIGQGSTTFFSLGKGPAFETLRQLIYFYQQKPINGVTLALRTPCPKSG